ncbi:MULTISPECIES: transporter substrate-binding domain-containing protein [unclassified Moraxella]|uniref:transporter substrate-binding domain-containing protein n=1 Tax=unclassified Moraxella TaxID=2685852 RepID=UPI003AF48A34
MELKLLSTMMCISLAMVGCDKSSQTSAPTTTGSTVASTTSTNNATVTASKLPANAQTYVVAVDANFAPFAFKDEKGNIIGFDKDILDAIGENQGFRINIIGDRWDNIFDDLNAGKFDLVGSAVSINAERQATMDFSKPYIESSIVIAYKDPDITSFDQLKAKKIAVQTGSYASDVLKENGIAPENIIEFKSNFLAYQAVVNGKADAVCEDLNVLNYLGKQLKSVTDTSKIKQMKLPTTESDMVGFAIKKGRKDLVDKVNQGLDNIKQDGTYDKIYAKWFGDKTISTSASSSASTTKN